MRFLQVFLAVQSIYLFSDALWMTSYTLQ